MGRYNTILAVDRFCVSMELARALGLGDTELVSFVGAGGKKTAIGRLIADADALRVGYTTTTHTPPLDGLPMVVGENPPLAATESPVAFAAGRVANPERADEKLRGFSPDTVCDLFAHAPFDWLLVKADGARRREFKAPGTDEPAVPAASTHVVPVAAVTAVGEPLAEPVVHRPGRIAALTNLCVGETLTPRAVGTVLASPEGGRKHAPPHATVTPLVNKADTPEKRALAREIVETVLDRSPIERGIVSSFETDYLGVIE